MRNSRERQTGLNTAGATHRAESDTTGRNKGLATIVSGDGRFAGVDLGRSGTAVVAIGLGSLLSPVEGTLRVITGQAVGRVLRAAGRVGRAAGEGRRTRRPRVEAASGRGRDRCKLGNHKSGWHVGRCLACSRAFAFLRPGGDPRWGVDLLVNQVEDLIVIVEGEKFLSGGLLERGQ